MSKYSDQTLDKIVAVYKEATRNTICPSWDALGPVLREAFFAVYFAGRKDAIDERDRSSANPFQP